MATLQDQAAHVIRSADFRDFWPLKVRLTLVRAAKTEGEMPLFAVRDVERSIRDARNIERRMAKDIAVGEATLSQVDKRRLLV